MHFARTFATKSRAEIRAGSIQTIFLSFTQSSSAFNLFQGLGTGWTRHPRFPDFPPTECRKFSRIFSSHSAFQGGKTGFRVSLIHRAKRSPWQKHTLSEECFSEWKNRILRLMSYRSHRTLYLYSNQVVYFNLFPLIQAFMPVSDIQNTFFLAPSTQPFSYNVFTLQVKCPHVKDNYTFYIWNPLCLVALNRATAPAVSSPLQ